MSYIDQNHFFALAYRTGSDLWTTIPFTRHASELALYLPKGACVLDAGAGRGRLLFELAEAGLRVIGLENNQTLVQSGNQEIKNKGKEKELRFIEGDIRDIPLEDKSVDAVVDVCLLQHILPTDHQTYMSEVSRVIKPGGFFFLVTLSKKTETYFTWHPGQGAESDFELEGVHYHFFTEEELHALTAEYFEVQYMDEDAPFGLKDTIFTVALFKKK